MLLVASGGRIGEMQRGSHTRRYGRRRGPRRGEQSRSRSWVTRGRAMHRSVPPRRPGGRTRRCAFAMRVDRSDGTWPPVRAGRNAHDDARPTSLTRGSGRKRLAALDRALHGATGDSARGGEAPAKPRGRIRIARLPLRYRRCRRG
jgi:hypothetical protein